jgi:hypothetical protein
MSFAIDAGDGPSTKDGGRVVELSLRPELSESYDCGNDVARERLQHRLELTSVRSNGEARGIVVVVREAAQDRLRATENRNLFRFAPFDTRSNQIERVHRACGRQRSLIGGNSQNERLIPI